MLYEVITACPRCGHERIALGEGTQRITDELATLFPDQTIARLDRDALTTRESLGEILADVESGRTGIIVGTQLLAKGHDVITSYSIHYTKLYELPALSTSAGGMPPPPAS